VVLQRVWAEVLDVGRGSDEVLRGQSGDEQRGSEEERTERRKRAWGRKKEELGVGREGESGCPIYRERAPGVGVERRPAVDGIHGEWN
jgi:hypothetical protein